MSKGSRRLERLIDVRASYSLYHLVKTIFLVSEKPQGRGYLLKELGLGEASVKTLMKKLQQAKIAKVTTKGLVLTESGRKLLASFNFSKPVFLDAGELTVGEKDCAILVKNAAEKIKSGLEQRDAAIKAGADGATVLVCRDGKLALPNMKRDLSELEKELRKHFWIENGDVVLIGTGGNPLNAEEGAFATVFSITDPKKTARNPCANMTGLGKDTLEDSVAYPRKLRKEWKRRLIKVYN